MNIVIAVDGPAGSGKSSVAKAVAAQLSIDYIDSGAIYRTITLMAYQKHGTLTTDVAFDTILDELEIEQCFVPEKGCITFANGVDVSKGIRSQEIVENINIVSSDKKVRCYVTSLLQKWGNEKSLIMDGRDIGTVVFPHADVKIYLTASVDVRAKRRYDEDLASGKNVDLKTIKKQIILRDEQDENREFGALVRSDDAVFVDTSDMIFEEVVDRLVAIINNATE